LLIGGYIGATCSPLITGMIVDRTGSFLLALLIDAVPTPLPTLAKARQQ
jgi:cyanate permease